MSKFFALDSKTFYLDVESQSISAINRLANFYQNDINCNDVISEYISFRHVYKDIFPNASDGLKANEVLTFLIANNIQGVFPNISTLCKLFLTLPVSGAKAERSFSRLKLIKSYLRSTMTESRLSNLALLSIERELAENLDFECIIVSFSNMKTRRKVL